MLIVYQFFFIFKIYDILIFFLFKPLVFLNDISYHLNIWILSFSRFFVLFFSFTKKEFKNEFFNLIRYFYDIIVWRFKILYILVLVYLKFIFIEMESFQQEKVVGDVIEFLPPHLLNVSLLMFFLICLIYLVLLHKSL